MNINELDSYNLADAVKFNSELNPAIWTGQEMKPEVREKLLAIADDFREFLGLSNLEVKDITVSGSNAAYTYTPHSDIDLHLVVDIPQADSDEVYRELFDAKKYQYNDLHDYKIHGYDVELYVENANKPPVSAGIYSIKNNDWIKIPRQVRATVDDEAVKSKFEDVGHRIESAVKSQDYEKIDQLAKKIKNFRQAGLDKSGEFGPENLAYKMLRKQGLIKQLYDARNAALDAELSLKEKAKIKKPVVYGFKTEDLDTDGVMMTRPTNCSSEAAVPDAVPSDEKILKDFIDFVAKELKLKELPQIKLRRDPQWSVVHKTFGRYIDDRNMLEVAWGQRHIMDVLRTVAHELTHRRQHEREDVPSSAGETGSPYENEANARAGILMRDYARLHPEYFEAGQAEQLHGDEVKESYADYFRTSAPVSALKPTQGTMNIEGYRVDYDAKNKSIRISRNGQVVHQEGGTSTGQGRPLTIEAIAARARRIINQLEGDEVDEGVKGKLGALAAVACIAGTPGCATTDIQSGLRAAQTVGNLSQIKRGNIERALGQDAKNVLRRAAGQVQNEGASGYIPTKKQAKDPRFSMALTQDIKPGQVGKEANKLDLETDSQGHPKLLIKNLANALESYKQTGKYIVESSQLDEVKMSPGALRKFAASPEAEGIMAGFEAELIFRDTQGDDDDGDYEADYDADERAYDIDGVIEFFSNDDYGYGLSPRQADRLRDDLDNAYFEWRDEQMMNDFERESDDLVREVWLEERPMVERIHSALTDGMGLTDDQADEVIKLHGQRRNKEISGSDMSEEQLDMASQYSEAKEIADSVLDEEVEASLDNQDGYYDQALDNFRDNYDADDSGFFSDMGWRWMSSIASEFNLDWPIMTGSGGSYGSRSWDEIADNLSETLGMPVKVGYGYHSAPRKPGQYVLEPDSSLSPDDSEDYGLELVSPPMPLNQAIEQLNAVVDWANSDGNAYTNSSTGLHMGVSIPFKGGDVDYVKLALFLGDQYVLEKFGRAANTYCDSALKKLKQNVAGSKNRGDDKITSAMELMKHGLIELAQRYVQQGVGNSKYTSAHIKPGYIEFRSPGGDYLSQGDREIGALEDTMRRFAYAMYLAGRPDLERNEYYKKLYKLIAPEGNKDLELFAKFSSGEITADELKKQWADKVIAKEVPVKSDRSNWRLYNRRTGEPVPNIEYGNYTEMDALERAKAKVSPASSMEDFKQAYELRDVGTNTGRWRVIRRDNHETLEIIDAPTRGEANDQARESYTDVIPFYIEPYGGTQEPEPKPKLSRRAKLAKQIAQPGDYVIINKHSGLPFYTFRASSQSQAVDFGVTYLRDKGLDLDNFSVQKASNVKQAIDNRVDSKQLQQRVQDVPMDVAQNFEQPQQVRMPSGIPVWELFDVDTGSVLNVFADHNAAEAKRQAMSWLRSIGAENPDTYGERFAVRAKQLQPGERNNPAVNENFETDGEKAMRALNMAAKKLGYPNYSAVPEGQKNTCRQMAVYSLNTDSASHPNFLKNKVK